jgi:hypothetical protein
VRPAALAGLVKVLAIDPGERVGWAHGVIEEESVPDLSNLDQLSTEDPVPYVDRMQLRVTGHGITVAKPFILKLAQVMGDYDVVVYERWTLAAGMAKQLAGSEMATSQVIGQIRYLSWLTPGVQLVGQFPKEMRTARKTAPREILDIIDSLPGAHDDSHDESALLHLWRYFQKRYTTQGGTP